LPAALVIMNYALIGKDYQTYIRFIHPKVIEHMGGEKGVLNTLKDMDAQMKQNGTTITDITPDDPSMIQDTAGELQCTIKESIEMKVKGGTLQNDVVFVGISKDNGKTWVFIDTSTDYSNIRKQFPTLSSLLVIPSPGQPVFESN
jgi:hypothetical protein